MRVSCFLLILSSVAVFGQSYDLAIRDAGVTGGKIAAVPVRKFAGKRMIHGTLVAGAVPAKTLRGAVTE